MILGPSGLALQCPKLRWHHFLLLTPINTVCYPTMHQQCPLKSGLCHMHCSCVSVPLRFTTELILLTEKRHHRSSEFGKLLNGKLMVLWHCWIWYLGGGWGRRIRRQAVLHCRLTPLKVLNKRATSFADSFHSLLVPKTERSSSQKNYGNHTKDSLGRAWHNMISAWCVEGWLVPALVKENLTKELHWLKSRADTSTTPEDESFLYMRCYTDLCLHEQQHVGTEREFQSSMYFTWNQ